MRMIKSYDDITYTEEDGYEIKRPEGTIMVYGAATATYCRTRIPGSRWDPPDETREREGDVSVTVTLVTDTEGNPIVGWITQEETVMFNNYMIEKLDYEADTCEWNEGI